MADTIKGIVRRIDFEPKKDFLEFRTYAHVFVQPKMGDEVDVYTEDPRFEAAFLAAFVPSEKHPPIVEVSFE